MSTSWLGRAARACGCVCLLIAVLLSRNALGCDSAGEIRAAADVGRGDRAPVWLDQPGAPPVLIYPPEAPQRSRSRLVVLLHGMCGHPENECSWFAGAATRDRFVVCPRADLGCNGGGYIWSGKSQIRDELVRSVRERVECAFPEQVSTEGATLVGFSLGGFVALDVAEHSRPGEWPHVLLIGARVAPSRSRLDRAGIASILFASGDWDMSRQSMRSSARLLARNGLRADYVGLGPIGHWFARDIREMDGWLSDALAWLEGA